jgi:hypothetical protein
MANHRKPIEYESTVKFGDDKALMLLNECLSSDFEWANIQSDCSFWQLRVEMVLLAMFYWM